MARAIIMSPGVQFQETDVSQYIRELTNVKLALVGVASKGEVDQNILITSLQQGIDKLGVPTEDYPALLVMREYFNAGGGRLNFVRVANGDEIATIDVPTIDDAEDDIVFTAPTSGSYYNDTTLKISYNTQEAQTVVSEAHTFAIGNGNYPKTLPGVPIVPGTVVIKFGTTKIATDNSAGVLAFETTLAEYAKYSGTVDYETGVVTIVTTGLVSAVSPTVNISYNAWTSFNIEVLYQPKDKNGDVVDTYALQSYKGLTIDTVMAKTTGSKHFIIEEEPAAFPVAGQYPMAGGDDGKDDITDVDFIGNTIGNVPHGMQVFAYPDQIDVNLLMVPGASASLAVRQAIIQLCEVARFDTLGVIDPPANLDVQTVADWANGNGTYNTWNTINSNYAALYYPWFTSFNNVNGDSNELTPPSAAAAAAFARSQPFEAPAGPNRGKLLNVTNVEYELNPNDRAFLGENRINSIADLQGTGIQVAAQQTATLTSSSLDRIGARMMLMRIEKAVTTALLTLLFEPNTHRTWSRAEMIVQPYLDALVRKQQIYQGLFICNDDTNTEEIVNNNQMACQCRLQLLKYAEIIVVNFVLYAYGAQITENVVGKAA